MSYHSNQSESAVHDLMSWLYYERDSIIWSSDYIPLDTSGNLIDKTEFFNQLITGLYFPSKKLANYSGTYYQLQKLPLSVNDELANVIKRTAERELFFYKKEGQFLPKFKFVDINNNIYDSLSLQGKVVVINCWFINCLPCVREIPKLNTLVETYRSKPDIVFLALAFDAEPELSAFLKKTPFSYKVIPKMEDYLRYDLGITGYPSHVVLGKSGKIVKIISGDKSEELPAIIDHELEK